MFSSITFLPKDQTLASKMFTHSDITEDIIKIDRQLSNLVVYLVINYIIKCLSAQQFPGFTKSGLI